MGAVTTTATMGRRIRPVASLATTLMVAASLALMPAPLGERVMCFGNDGHVAIVSPSFDECCEHDSEQPAGFSFALDAIQTGDCVDCIDRTIPGSEGRQPARVTTSKHANVSLDLPTSLSLISPDPAGTCTMGLCSAPIPTSFVALRSVTLLI